MAERDLHPVLADKLQQLQDLAAAEGITIRVTQGVRSPEEQARLYAQGRTTPGRIVTYAKPGQSRHQHGAAFDVVPLTDGKPDWDSPHWGRLGELGESLGLRWGGRFPRLKDRPHFELADAGDPARAPTAPLDGAPGHSGGRRDQRALLIRMIQLQARKAGVDPDLAVAVAMQESGLDPGKVGDRGKSLGLFQLQRAAAIDAGIDPDRRGEPEFNIPGGIRYLKQGLDRFGGDPRQALERHYNRGGDPDYYAHVMQYYPGAPGPPGVAQRSEPMPSQIEMTERLRAIRQRKLQLPGPAAQPAPGEPARAPGPPGPAGAQSPTSSPAPQAVGPGVPTADTQVQMLRQQEQGRLQAEQAVGSPTRPAPTLGEFGRGAAATGISAGSAMLGTAAGTLAAPFMGPLAPVMPLVGEMTGSYLARQLNVGLGLEEPGMVGDVASVAVPPVLRGVSKVVTPVVKSVTKAVVRRLPGAATTMHQEVGERLARMTDSLLPPVDSRTLYSEAARYNPGITPTAVARDATEILQAERALQPSLRNGKLMRVAHDLTQMTQSGPVPMEDFYAHQQRVGELVREARSKGGVGEGRIKQLYGAFHEDLETAAGKGVQGAQELKDAIAASRKEHVAAEFDQLFKPGSNGVTIDPEGRLSLNGGRMETAWRRTLARDKVLRETLTPEEKAEVEGIIKYAQRLERLNVPKGGQRGSGRAAVGAAIGAVVGGPGGAALGVYGPELLAKAMQTPAGRRLVLQAMTETSKGGADTTTMTALAALVRQQMNAPETAQSPGTGAPAGP